MTWGWLKYLTLGMAVFFALWLTVTGIYNTGYDKAQAEGEATLATLKQEYANTATARWAEYALKEQEARERLQEEQTKANALEAELIKTKNTLVAERRGFAKRIADATLANDFVFTADIVRLYNEALYGPAYAPIVGSKNDTANTAYVTSSANTPAHFGSGILQEQPVTVKDLLAHAKLYGEWAREVYAIALGWTALSANW